MSGESQGFQLVPVVDLMRGQVVRGMGGKRESYQPIRSLLCGTSEPLAVAQALCAHCASSVLYVADLDALLGGPAQVAVLADLLEGLPELRLWLDAGFADVQGALAVREALGPLGDRLRPIFASESLASRQALQACTAPGGPLGGRVALSLDRRGPQRLDPAGCWEAPELWPADVIVMTLERVGSGAGPDLQTFAGLQGQAPGARFFGAGGVRSPDDLAAAQAAGAAGWLVASALHDGHIPRVAPRVIPEGWTPGKP
jgi:uncharacterized protein related to proFAR isomerase